jgi:hypothetical protein
MLLPRRLRVMYKGCGFLYGYAFSWQEVYYKYTFDAKKCIDMQIRHSRLLTLNRRGNNYIR